MEILIVVAIVAVAGIIGFKILQKQRSQNSHPLDVLAPKYPADNGPLTAQQVDQIQRTVEKPVQAEVKTEFTGFPKSEPEVSSDVKKEPTPKKPRKNYKSVKPQSNNAPKKKTKKTA